MRLLNTLTILLYSLTTTFAQINSASFATKVDYSTGTGTQKTLAVAVADLDGDGKIDIAATNNSNTSNSVSIFRNTSVHGVINSASLSAPISATTGTEPIEICAGDVDGDNKPDLLVANFQSNTISIFRNTSTIGNISFSTKVDFATIGANPTDILLEDLNGDGKKEVITTLFGTNTLCIHENLSTPGTILLQTPPTNLTVSGGTATGTRELAIEDLDGDGKKDIAVVCYNGYTALFRNTSTLATISFATSINLTGISLNAGLSVADIDSDGKKDIAVSSNNTGVAMVYKNNSSLGVISFASFISYNIGAGTGPFGNKLIDLDNDNKPELVVCNRSLSHVSIFRSFAVAGVINGTTYGNKRDFTTGSMPTFVEFADIDADGKPEMIIPNYNSNSISILKNQTKPSNGLIAYYPFNGNAGDSSGFENHGTAASGVSNTTDRKNETNKAFAFNGSSSAYVNVPSNVSLNTANLNNITISCWFRANNSSISQRIFNFQSSSSPLSNYELSYYTPTQNLEYINWSGTSSAVQFFSSNLPLNTWHFIALVIDSTNSTKLYVNGVLQGSSTNAVVKPVNPVLSIGRHLSNGWNFNGAIDEFRVYNRALTLAQINEIGRDNPIYYSKASGNLNSLSTWGTNPDGSGTSPLNFDSSNVIYHVVNNTAPVLGGNLRINGSNSTLVFGDGANAFNLSIASNDTISCDSIFVRDNITLTNNGTIVCTRLGAANTSNVQYIRSSSQSVAAGSYGNLVVSSSTKTLTGNTVIKGSFGMLASVHCNGFNLTLGSSTSTTGVLNRTAGTIIGRFTRWFNNTTNTGTSGLFPVGTATKYTPYQIEFTGAPTTGGTITCEFITGNPGNIGLPQFDFTVGAVFIDKAAQDGVWRLSGSGVTGGTFNATITANNFLGVNSYADLRLIRRVQSGSWTLQGNATVNSGSNTAAVVGRTGLSTIYGEYGIGGDQSVNPLPVQLISFTASLMDDEHTVLQWVTLQEFNADKFIIQRSTDQINWVDRGVVKAKGFSTSTLKYAFTDVIDQPFKVFYYRLVEVDINGKKTGSKTVSVVMSKQDEFTVFPNPAQRDICIKGLTDGAIIYDITGIPVLSVHKDGWVTIEQLKPGIYFIKSTHKTIRLVKE